jgi:hypothetical protein
MERGTRLRELRAILMRAPSCSAQPSGRWRVHGVDGDGDALDVIVVIRDGLIVVTLFG